MSDSRRREDSPNPKCTKSGSGRTAEDPVEDNGVKACTASLWQTRGASGTRMIAAAIVEEINTSPRTLI